jgi:hypothetical protein
MAATTISRATWTNDTGTPSTPNADGTILNNARLQADVYDKIDAVLGATLTLGGLVHSEGFGTHLWSAGGTGGNIFSLRNPTAGTGNFAQQALGNDSGANVARLRLTASNFTAATVYPQDGLSLVCDQAGGLSLAAIHASGLIKFYAGGTTERFRMTADGALWIITKATTPTAPSSNTDWMFYCRGKYIVLAYNNGGTPKYFYLAGDQSGGTWTESTTAPS